MSLSIRMTYLKHISIKYWYNDNGILVKVECFKETKCIFICIKCVVRKAKAKIFIQRDFSETNSIYKNYVLSNNEYALDSPAEGVT